MLSHLIFFFCYLSSFSSHLVSAGGVLYVWSGQSPNYGPTAADFVAVVDYDPKSKNYGKIIDRVGLPHNHSTLKPTGNEPHHGILSRDNKYFIVGGLLSFLQGSDQVFAFEVRKNRKKAPKLVWSVSPPGGCTDAFLPFGSSSSAFLFTQMCASDATAPGHLVYIDIASRTVSSLTQNLPAAAAAQLAKFNPHGFDIGSDNQTVTTVSYIVPLTLTDSSPADIVFRNETTQFRVIDRPGRSPTSSFIRNIEVPTSPRTIAGTGRGFMSFKIIPTDPQQRGYTCGTNDNFVYLLNPTLGTMSRVFDLVTVTTDHLPHLSAGGSILYSPDGKRVLGAFQMRYVVLLDITVRDQPTLLQSFDFCTDPSLAHYRFPLYGHPDTLTTYSEFCANNGGVVGSHYAELIGNRFIVVNYFLQFGLAQFPGTRTIHSFTFTDNTYSRFTIDLNFNPNPEFLALQASPHVSVYLDTPGKKTKKKNGQKTTTTKPVNHITSTPTTTSHVH